MKRPRLSNVLTAVVIALGVGGLVTGYVAFGQYAASQQHQRDEAVATVHEKDKLLDEKDAQLARLFANYVKSVNDCKNAVSCESTTPAPDVVQQNIQGAPGATGATGPGATDAQVSRQIEIYCAAHDDCAGPAGANGVGTNGQNGSDGAPGADSTVPGPQGPPGADGRGIASTVCDDSGEWQVTYTDGSTQDAGSCRMSLINP